MKQNSEPSGQINPLLEHDYMDPGEEGDEDFEDDDIADLDQELVQVEERAPTPDLIFEEDNHNEPVNLIEEAAVPVADTPPPLDDDPVIEEDPDSFVLASSDSLYDPTTDSQTESTQESQGTASQDKSQIGVITIF